MKMHEILIMLILVGLIAFGIAGFMTAGVAEYNPTGYNDTYFSKINASNQKMINLSENIRTNMTVFEGNPGLLDYISGGAYLITSSVKAAWISAGSTATMMSISQDSVNQLPLGNFGGYLVATIGAIILILIIVGFVLYIWTKGDRI